MEENFEPVARTRANYYTPGSPVQFVCVELLKGEVSGDTDSNHNEISIGSI